MEGKICGRATGLLAISFIHSLVQISETGCEIHGCPQCEHGSLLAIRELHVPAVTQMYEGWNFNTCNYLFTTDTK